MLKNLKYEMGVANISIRYLADFLEISESSASNKLKGKTDFTMREINKISKFLFPKFKMEYLFDDFSDESSKIKNKSA